jgi:hypothetical protein
MSEHHFVICTDNRGYEVSLEVRKLYEVFSDLDADKHGYLRVVDESGEDYLYPKSCFLDVDLPDQVIEQILHAA